MMTSAGPLDTSAVVDEVLGKLAWILCLAAIQPKQDEVFRVIIDAARRDG